MKYNLKKRAFAVVLAALMVFGCMTDGSFGTLIAMADTTVSGNELGDEQQTSVSGNDASANNSVVIEDDLGNPELPEGEEGENGEHGALDNGTVSGNDLEDQIMLLGDELGEGTIAYYTLSYNGIKEEYVTASDVIARIEEIDDESVQYEVEIGEEYCSW